MWFLEAQFGADNVGPVEEPKLPPLPAASPKEEEQKKEGDEDDAMKAEKPEEEEQKHANGTDTKAEDMDLDDKKGADDEDEAKQQLQERQFKEIARLHKLGIPVPGISIKVDKMTATIWLEDLEVECNNKVFADRVRAVVERAVEVTAPLWG